MKLPPFPEQQRRNPQRDPAWRWERANDLLRAGMNFSKKRDDKATGIALRYVRDVHKSLMDDRLERVRKRYHHVAQAHDIWRGDHPGQPELETRILARQNDTEIGLAMGLPPATVQAYADLFFHIRDRIDAGAYIQYQIIGLHPQRPPTPFQMMQACVYHHGPLLIEPWFQYLRDKEKHFDLETVNGRVAAALDLLVRVHFLPHDLGPPPGLGRRISSVLKTPKIDPKSVTASAGFRRSTSNLLNKLKLPARVLEPCSYAPNAQSAPDPKTYQHDRQAA